MNKDRITALNNGHGLKLRTVRRYDFIRRWLQDGHRHTVAVA
jgi:hypothetical protein